MEVYGPRTTRSINFQKKNKTNILLIRTEKGFIIMALYKSANSKVYFYG